jgi:hypothetical protein
MKTDRKVARKNNVKNRLQRLKNLRKCGAPKWIIKSEQIALFLNSKGRKHYGIGYAPSQCQAKLYEKHVQPLMGM